MSQQPASSISQQNKMDLPGRGEFWRPEVLIFNLLPSMTLHPERHSQFLSGEYWSCIGDTAKTTSIMHRHWSQVILKELRLEDTVVEDSDDLELRIALLSLDELDQLTSWLGVRLCSEPFRKAIRGDEVRSMMNALGAPLVEAVRLLPDSTLAVVYGPANEWTVQQALTRYRELGIAALLHACEPAGDALTIRLTLKLAPVGYWEMMPEVPALKRLIVHYFQMGEA